MLEVTLKARKGRRRKRQEDTREGGRRKNIRHSSRPIHVVTEKRRKAEDKKNVDEETLRGVFGGVMPSIFQREPHLWLWSHMVMRDH